MKKITRELLRDWYACYSDDRIHELVPVEGLTPAQVLDRTDVPVEDRLWVVLRESVIPRRELHLLACKWAREALAVVGNPDPRSVAAIDCAERFARGKATTEELAAAWDSACAAAWDSACAAACDAACDAACSAACDAAWAAARAAAWAAAWAAACDAARAAQVADCRATLTTLAGDAIPQ